MKETHLRLKKLCNLRPQIRTADKPLWVWGQLLAVLTLIAALVTPKNLNRKQIDCPDTTYLQSAEELVR